VTILITDVNDSPPVFQFKNYQAEVEENSSPGTKITVLEAYDPDEITAEVMETQVQVKRSIPHVRRKLLELVVEYYPHWTSTISFMPLISIYLYIILAPVQYCGRQRRQKVCYCYRNDGWY
jgi:hypothetical protein